MLFCADPRMEVYEEKLASPALPGNRRSCRGMPINLPISPDEGHYHLAGKRPEPHTGNPLSTRISADAARPNDVATSWPGTII